MTKQNNQYEVKAIVTEHTFQPKDQNKSITYYDIYVDVGGELFKVKLSDIDKRYFYALSRSILKNKGGK